MRRRLAGLGLLGALVGTGCRTHTQNEGTYALHVDEVVRDGCHLLGGPDTLGSVNLTLNGNALLVDYPLVGIQMKGLFELTQESFLADGSAANVETQVEGQQCLVELVNVHMTGTTDTSTTFHGSLRVSYQSHGPSACICDFAANFHATQH